MARIEHKYLIRNDCLPHIRQALKPYLRYDHYAAKTSSGEYTVRSIYFDTRNMDFYHEKIEGLRVRKKIRVRGYNHREKDAMVFLEIKKKKDYFIKKHRSPVAYKSLIPLMVSGDVRKYVFNDNGNPPALDDAKRFLFQVHHRSLRPYILIVYEREAYYSNFHHDLRITFDKNIRSLYPVSLDALFRDSKCILTMPNHSVLEIKSVIEYPSWLQSVLSKFELKQEAISKYAKCLDSHAMSRTKLNIISNGHFNLKA